MHQKLARAWPWWDDTLVLTKDMLPGGACLGEQRLRPPFLPPRPTSLTYLHKVWAGCCWFHSLWTKVECLWTHLTINIHTCCTFVTPPSTPTPLVFPLKKKKCFEADQFGCTLAWSSLAILSNLFPGQGRGRNVARRWRSLRYGLGAVSWELMCLRAPSVFSLRC